MQNTTNYNLKKPDGTDYAKIASLNENADIIDTKLKELEDGKVAKVSGKGLSTNDYTTAEKNKLAGIASGANKTVVNNTLTSTSTTDALSANQGKVLKDLVDSKASSTDLSNLQTEVTEHLAEVGQLTNLKTSDKSTLVNAINEVFQAGNNVKSDIVTSLLSIDPSLPITTDSTWAEIEAAILEVQTGVDTSDATATAAQILSNATAYVKGNKVTGAMPNRGAVTGALNAGNSYTIPEGYHDGSGKVTANSLASQTVSDAVAANILSGKTAWVNGSKITGTISSRGAATITPGTTNQTIAANQFLSGIQTILGDPDLIPANIISGKNIFGVVGTANVASLGGKQLASGSVVSSTTSINFDIPGGNISAMFYVTVSGLTFKPSIIILCSTSDRFNNVIYGAQLWGSTASVIGRNNSFTEIAITGNAYINATGFRLPVLFNKDHTYNYVAIG